MLKSLFNKVLGRLDDAQLYQEKNSGKGVFPVSFPKSLKDLPCRTCPNGCLSEMNQKNLYSQNLFTGKHR